MPGFDPYVAFGRLLAHTDAPFAGFLRRGEQFALCMSPERFLRIEGNTISTQPMKGTRRRVADPQQDAAIALELATDPKERSENIMAVANRMAEEIKAEAQAEVGVYYAEFEKNPQLRLFLDRVDAVKLMLKERSTLILDELSPDWLLQLVQPGGEQVSSKATTE